MGPEIGGFRTIMAGDFVSQEQIARSASTVERKYGVSLHEIGRENDGDITIVRFRVEA